METDLIVNKRLIAAYCGLVKSGYDLTDLSDRTLKEIFEKIQQADFGVDAGYFAFTRTNLNSVNPYYPRGSDLAVSCFFDSSAKYFDFLRYCGSPSADDEEFETWISKAPEILEAIENGAEFQRIFDRITAYILTSFLDNRADFRQQTKQLKQVAERFPCDSIKTVIFSPNPLQSKYLADYVFTEETLFIISADFSASAALHEYLHIAVKSETTALQKIAETCDITAFADMAAMRETGYGNDRLHVLEECIVRALCGAADKSLDLPLYLKHNSDSGFTGIYKLIEKLNKLQNKSIKEIINAITAE